MTLPVKILPRMEVSVEHQVRAVVPGVSVIIESEVAHTRAAQMVLVVSPEVVAVDDGP
jgi:hypothetical protein